MKIPRRKPNKYWTKERCRKEALRFTTRAAFLKRSPSAYSVSSKKGWLNDICSHIKSLQKKPKGYWTKSACAAEAKKYRSRRGFYKKSGGAYSAALKNNWIDAICGHMNTKKKNKSGFWTRTNCHREAQKYKSRVAFYKYAPAAYSAAHKKGFIDAICGHMESIGSRYKRAIYAFEFEDKSVYVGLTFNYEKRHLDHRREGPVSRKLKTHSAVFVKFDTWYDNKTAQRKEWETIEHYRRKGWKILNKQKPGGLGGVEVYWTKERCVLEAARHRSKSELQRRAIGCYSSALKNGWLEEVCMHMENIKKPSGYWTFKKCESEAKQCRSRMEFSVKAPSAYATAKRNLWLDKMCTHMKNRKQKPKFYWTKEKCFEAGRKCENRTDFYKKFPRGYVVSKENSWLNEMFLRKDFKGKNKKSTH